MIRLPIPGRYILRWRSSTVARRIVHGNLWALAGSGISRLLGLLATIIVARALGKVHFGEFGMIQVTVGMFGTVAGVGLGSTASKYVAQYRTADGVRTGRILALSSLSSWIAGAAMSIALFALSPWLAVHSLNAPQLIPQLQVSTLLLLFGGINGAQTGSLSGFEAFRSIAQINFWVGLLSFPCLVIGVHLGGLTGALWGAVANLVIGCSANALCLRSLLRRNRIEMEWRHCLKELPVIWDFSVPVILSALTVAPATWLSSTFLAASRGGYAALGSFSVGNQWRNAILFVPWVLGSTALPTMSNLHGLNDLSGYRRAIYLNTLLVGCVAGSVTLGIFFGAHWIVASYGAGFGDSVSVVRMMALCGFLYAVNVVPAVTLTSSGRPWLSFFLTFSFSMILVGLAYPLANSLSAYGLALAHTLSYGLLAAVQGTVVYCLFKPGVAELITTPTVRGDESFSDSYGA